MASTDSLVSKHFYRICIDAVSPQVDEGRYPIKRTVNEAVHIKADIYADGHEVIRAVVRFRPKSESMWREAPLSFVANDVWEGFFLIERFEDYVYTVSAWIDSFRSWKAFIEKKHAAGQEIASELAEGTLLLKRLAGRADEKTAGLIIRSLPWFEAEESAARALEFVRSPALAEASDRYPDYRARTDYHKELQVAVDRDKARFSSWYEMFPRSSGRGPQQGGSFAQAAERLPEIAAMGFDVLYLPPVHPIGLTCRKAPNNRLQAVPGDPGCPWAIGGPEGGHKAVDPGLGTLEDFRRFREAAESCGLEVALDLAFQCSPDHPYVAEHPEWFNRRPDGTIHYAENPPKKYQDIYPLNFESAQWPALWEELKSVVEFWIDQGVKIFRVDNPHTKVFSFWEWLIAEIRRSQRDVIFLSEAFTRPKVMHRLTKLGFTQSYTYFTWRNSKYELTEYLTELTQGPAADFFRPNFFANTPDILHAYLQHGGRPAFIIRLVLAATMSSNYGIYSGYELCENTAVAGTEEYENSEKYQVRIRDWNAPGNIKDIVASVNTIRRSHPALQFTNNITFCAVDNDSIIAYLKRLSGADPLLIVVNLDPHAMHEATLTMPLELLGIGERDSYEMIDLLNGVRYRWYGRWNYVRLDPAMPAHVFRVHPNL